MKTAIALSLLFFTLMLPVAATSAHTDRRLAVQTPSLHVTVVGPYKLSIQNVHSYRDSIGTLYLYGQISNHGAAKAADVGVEVDLYNSQNQRLARGATLMISQNVLLPGATAVWMTDMTDSPATWRQERITTGVQISAPDFLSHNYTGFKVTDLKWGTDNPGYSEKITGHVKNVGAQVGKVDELIAALYDAKGALIRVADQGLLYPYSSKQLVNVGKSAPFIIDINGYTARPARLILYIRAEIKPQPTGFTIG